MIIANILLKKRVILKIGFKGDDLLQANFQRFEDAVVANICSEIKNSRIGLNPIKKQFAWGGFVRICDILSILTIVR